MKLRLEQVNAADGLPFPAIRPKRATGAMSKTACARPAEVLDNWFDLTCLLATFLRSSGHDTIIARLLIIPFLALVQSYRKDKHLVVLDRTTRRRWESGSVSMYTRPVHPATSVSHWLLAVSIAGANPGSHAKYSILAA